MEFSDVLKKSGEFNRLIEKFNQKDTPVHVRGVSESAKSCLIHAVLDTSLAKNALIVVSDDLEAQNMYQDLRFFMGENVVYFPSKDYIFYNAYAHDGNGVRQYRCVGLYHHH